ncbi:MAG: hypothetical protein K6E97_07035 [Treponema sp.]|jgi:hypothetical protein|nr:hypothetical protein [Treponema sp.]
MKRFLLIFVMVFASALLCAQVPSIEEKIRFPLWADIDAYPEFSEFAEASDTSDTDFSYAVKQIKKISSLIVNGMVYGWEFTVVPSDKTRRIQEFVEVKPIEPLDEVEKNIIYSSPWVEDNRLNCWIDYNRSEYQKRNYQLWTTIKNPSIQGRGFGPIEKGFDGIQTACEDALKNAILDYYKKIIRNKPREIRGKVLIKKPLLLGIDSGRYTVTLDFFLESSTIIEYKQF